MTGVEILSSETIYNTFLPEWCLVIGFVLFLAFMVPLAASIANEKTILVIIFIFAMVGSIFVMIFSDTENKNSINHIEYKVTIDDSVSMNEFLDKYEILDQEGKIYTVKERE